MEAQRTPWVYGNLRVVCKGCLKTIEVKIDMPEHYDFWSLKCAECGERQSLRIEVEFR